MYGEEHDAEQERAIKLAAGMVFIGIYPFYILWYFEDFANFIYSVDSAGAETVGYP